MEARKQLDGVEKPQSIKILNPEQLGKMKGFFLNRVRVLSLIDILNPNFSQTLTPLPLDLFIYLYPHAESVNALKFKQKQLYIFSPIATKV